MQIDKILSLAEITDKIKINEHLCTNIRTKNKVVCNLCILFCPKKAITLENSVNINWEKCIYCGICSSVCNNGVFVFSDEFKILNEVKNAKEKILFNCNLCGVLKNSKEAKFRQNQNVKIGKETTEIKIPCIGILNEMILLYGLLLKKEIDFNVCEENCICISGKEVFEKNLELANLLFSAFEKAKVVIGKDDRRNFILFATKKAIFSSLNFEEEEKEKNLKQTLPFRRKMLLEIVKNSELKDKVISKEEFCEMKKPKNSDLKNEIISIEQSDILEKEMLKKSERREELVEMEMSKNSGKEIPFAEIEISNGCNFCYVCCVLCPSSALSFFELEDKAFIYFNFRTCINCKICDEVCDKNAISFKKEVNLKNLKESAKVLISKKMKNCEKCNSLFVQAKDEKICQECRKTMEIELK